MERPGKEESTDQNVRIEETIQMKKSINLLKCTSILVAVTGHVSIFINSSLILANAGSIGLTLIMWTIGGFINLFQAMCFTELAAMFPFAGGSYTYIFHVFGPLPAFLVLWGTYLLVQGPFWAFVSYGASMYILQPFFPTCRPPEICVKILGGWILEIAMERQQSDVSVDGDAVRIHVEKIQMKKSINLLHCTAILVAVTGHVSIFISPTMILTNTGSVGLTLIMWIVGGFINLSLALCFTELGTMFPFSGGPYVYILNVFGPLPAFMMLWGYFLLINGPFWAFVSYGASVYILQPFFPTCRPPEIVVKILGGWILVTFVALNGVYMKYVTKVQTFLSSTKVIGLLLIVVCGVIQLARGETDNFENIMANSKTDLGSISFAAFFSTFSYGGWQVISSLMEETKNPARDLPRAVYITFFIVMIVYILTNVAFFTVLSPTELLRSDAVAVLFMQNFYGPLTPVITILVGLCCIGVLNASIMGHSRVLFAGARNGHFPSIFGTLQTTFLTPWAAILAITSLALFLLFSGGLVLFIEYIQVFSIIMTLMVLSALLYLRRYRPEMKRPYKVNIALPIVMLVINFVMLLICVITEPTRTGMALVLFFTGVPLYLIGVVWKSKPKSFNDIMYKTTVILQKTFLLGKSE